MDQDAVINEFNLDIDISLALWRLRKEVTILLELKLAFRHHKNRESNQTCARWRLD